MHHDSADRHPGRATTPHPPAVPTTVGRYLLDRLAGLGVGHVFGVPGDYGLAFLDGVDDHESLRWVGTAGELGAAYAADGYARIRGFGALFTTFGVGELSAINGVAGSYAENVPLLHLVLGPSRASERAGANVHHTLGDGDYEPFARAHAQVTCAAESLTTGEGAPARIDRVLATALRERRPGYLRLPADVAALPVHADPAAPLAGAQDAEADPASLARFVSAAGRRLDRAGTAAVLVDFLAERFGAAEEVAALVSAGPLPHAALSSAKALLDETAAGSLGVYSGLFSPPATREAVDGADLLIRVGVRLSDTTSGFFSQGFSADKGIDVRPAEAVVDGEVFVGVPMRPALAALTRLVAERSFPDPSAALSPQPAAADTGAPVTTGAPLTTDGLCDTLASWLRAGDTLVADQGTSFFGIVARRFPRGTRMIGQPLWGSIGYALPALLGAQLADPARRGVLLVGDGAAQITIPELGTFARNGLRPVIVLVDNDGYTIERAIHGPRRPYNDIAAWDWAAVPAALGAPDALVLDARTGAEFGRALEVARAHEDRLVLVVAHTGRDDSPQLLRRIAEAARTRNAGGAPSAPTGVPR